MNDWTVVNCGELLDFRSGRSSPARGEQGLYEVFGSNGVIGRSQEMNTKGPFIVIGRVGSYCGSLQYVNRDAWVTDNAIRATPKGSFDARYLYYLLGQAGLERWRGGSGQPLLNQESLRSIPVAVTLDPTEQRAIAGVLGALDDKIESNRRAMQHLEKLFMHECESILASSEPVDGKRLADLAELSLGGTPSRANPAFWDSGEIPWINSGCLHERPVLTPADYITQLGLERSATKLIPAGSTVVAITGATLGVVSRLGAACAINQSIVAISAPDVALNTYLHFWMRSNIAALVSSATGAAQQHVNKSNFEELEVGVPTGSALESIGERTGLLDHEVLLAKENQTLTALRDALLPELLSGRLRVREAQEIVGSV